MRNDMNRSFKVLIPASIFYLMLTAALFLLPPSFKNSGGRWSRLFIQGANSLLAFGCIWFAFYPSVRIFGHMKDHGPFLGKESVAGFLQQIYFRIPTAVLSVLLAGYLATIGSRAINRFSTEKVRYFHMEMGALPGWGLFLLFAVGFPLLLPCLYAAVLSFCGRGIKNSQNHKKS